MKREKLFIVDSYYTMDELSILRRIQLAVVLIFGGRVDGVEMKFTKQYLLDALKQYDEPSV